MQRGWLVSKGGLVSRVQALCARPRVWLFSPRGGDEGRGGICALETPELPLR